MPTKLTEKQFDLLRTAAESGGADRLSVWGTRRWHTRTVDALVKMGLLGVLAPRDLTPAGHEALAAENERKLQYAYRRGEAWACHTLLKRREAAGAAAAVGGR